MTSYTDEQNWIKVQEKTFIRWCNAKLQNHPHGKELLDLKTDFRDGLQLIYLIEVLSESKFPYEYFKIIRYEIHCQENISLSLKYLKKHNLKIINVDFKDIYEGNVKLVLGLIWSIIKSYDILNESDNQSAISDNQMKTELLIWANKILKGYGMSLKNFKEWKDGKKFQALVHALKREGPEDFVFEPELTPEKRVEKAMDTAEQYHYIPKLMDAIDFLSGIDLLSNVTLIAMIKNEFERGPEKRLEKKRQIALAEKSRFSAKHSPKTTVKEFMMELINFEGNKVPHNKNLSQIEIVVEYQSLDVNEDPKLLGTNISPAGDGTYLVALLSDRPGTYTIKAFLEKELVGEPIVIKIAKIISKLVAPQRTYCRNKKVPIKLHIENVSELILADTKFEIGFEFSASGHVKDSQPIEEQHAGDEKADEEENQKEKGLETFAGEQEMGKDDTKEKGHEDKKKDEDGKDEKGDEKKEVEKAEGKGSEVASQNLSEEKREDEASTEVSLIEVEPSKLEELPDGDIAVLFVPDKVGIYTFRGKVDGQKISNALRITVEDPAYKTEEDKNNNYGIGDVQKLIVRLLDSAGESMDGAAPRFLIAKRSVVDDSLRELRRNSEEQEAKPQAAEDGAAVGAPESAVELSGVAADKVDLEGVQGRATEEEKEISAERKESELIDKEKEISADNEKKSQEVADSRQIVKELEEKAKEDETNASQEENAVKFAKSSEEGSEKEKGGQNGEEQKAPDSKAETVSVASAANGSHYEITWVPSCAGKFKILAFGGDLEKVVFEKLVDIGYCASPETSRLIQIDSEHKVFEGVTTAKFAIQLRTRSEILIPTYDPMDSVQMKFRILECRSSLLDEPSDIFSKVVRGQNPGEYFGEFFTDAAGTYEISLEINGEKTAQGPQKLKVSKKPLWILNGKFRSGIPNETQKIELKHRDRSGEEVPSNDIIKCVVMLKGQSETSTIFSDGNKIDKVISWKPSKAGVYTLHVFISERVVFKFEDLSIKNPVEIKNSSVVCKSMNFQEINVPIKFEIHLKDAENNLIGQGGDEDFLKVGYRMIRIGEEDGEDMEIETHIDNIESKDHGVYTFSFSSEIYAEYNVMASYEGEAIPNSPIKIGVIPPLKSNEQYPEVLSSLGDDHMFLMTFYRYSEIGIKAFKIRSKNLMRPMKSEGILKLVFTRTENVAIVFKKKTCNLIHVSRIIQGKRTTRFNQIKEMNPLLCFSVISNTRTFDFAVNRTEERNIWVRGLNLILEDKLVKNKSIYANSANVR